MCANILTICYIFLLISMLIENKKIISILHLHSVVLYYIGSAKRDRAEHLCLARFFVYKANFCLQIFLWAFFLSKWQKYPASKTYSTAFEFYSKWRLCRRKPLDDEGKCVRQNTVLAHLVVDAFSHFLGLLQDCRFATIVIPQLCDGIAIHLMLVVCLFEYVTDVAQRDGIFVCINYSSPITR